MKDANELLVAAGPQGFVKRWAEVRREASGSRTPAPGKPSAEPAPHPVALAAHTAPWTTQEAAAKGKRAAPEPATLSEPAGAAEPASMPAPTPGPASSTARLTSEAGVYTLGFGERLWRVKGLTAYGVDRLRVNVRVEEGGRFHVDTLDLYSSRARESFVEKAIKVLRLPESSGLPLLEQVSTLIDALEKERLTLREGEAKPEATEMSEVDRAEAMAFLQGDILAALKADFLSVGLVGEVTSMLTGYLALVSRKLAEPLSILFCARSGAGKSTLQDRLCDLCPPEDLVKYTRISGQVLFYKDEDALKHKLLAVDEEDGATHAAYALRSLLSSGYLSCSVTRTDPQTGRQVADDRKVNGPASNFLTTAHPEALDYETRNRYLLVTIDESREQTERILHLQRWNETVEGLIAREKRSAIFRRHHNAQRLLLPLDIVIPVELAYPSGYLILRREQKKYLALIKAVALLHQHQRPRKTLSVDGRSVTYIEATPGDVGVARSLAGAILARNLDELAPPSRSLLVALQEIVRAKKQAVEVAAAAAVTSRQAEGREDGGAQEPPKVRRYVVRRPIGSPEECDERLLVTRQEVQRTTGLSYWHVRTYMAQLVEYEYVAQVRGHQGRRTLYELLWEGDEDDPAAVLA